MLHHICPSTAELDCVIPAVAVKEVIAEIDHIHIEPSAESMILPLAKILDTALGQRNTALEYGFCP